MSSNLSSSLSRADSRGLLAVACLLLAAGAALFPATADAHRRGHFIHGPLIHHGPFLGPPGVAIHVPLFPHHHPPPPIVVPGANPAGSCR